MIIINIIINYAIIKYWWYLFRGKCCSKVKEMWFVFVSVNKLEKHKQEKFASEYKKNRALSNDRFDRTVNGFPLRSLLLNFNCIFSFSERNRIAFCCCQVWRFSVAFVLEVVHITQNKLLEREAASYDPESRALVSFSVKYRQALMILKSVA